MMVFREKIVEVNLDRKWEKEYYTNIVCYLLVNDERGINYV